MMDEGLLDPLETVSKDPELIKAAQKELAKIDVFICGGCHSVFHFIEEFKKHKDENECTNISDLNCENDEKPQVWAFTLWKTKYVQNFQGDIPSSWDIYQKWISLDKLEKDLWLSAGRTLLTCHKISTAKIQEIDVKKKVVERDPLAISKDDIIKNSKTAVRTAKEDQEEYNVEQVLNKRFNPRKRQWEYEVKWENYAEVTWEPLAHLENCKQLVQEFEDKLKAEKEKNKAAATPKPRGRPKNSGSTPSSPNKLGPKKTLSPPTTIVTTPGGRPQRTSKQKAMNVVKAWCGNISDSEEASGKRPFEDDDSDDSFEKKMKMDDTDTEEDEPRNAPKKVAKIIHTYSNGVGKKLPDNVLIPDAKGVVRISQKQLPSLSSGVYIMSKSSGIIKLDPTASKIATSGGQAIVKVSPKIGQTQIKIIKKDDGTMRKLIQTTKPAATSTATPTKTLKVVQTPYKPLAKKELEKTPKPANAKVTTPKAVVKEKSDPIQFPQPSVEEESDDGIEELEFPKDIPIPLPDSPPSEFILDPATGKIAGREYPNPSPEPVIYEDMKKEVLETSLENIVKLAAADITEDDLKPDGVEEAQQEQRQAIKLNEPLRKAGESILNKAISSSNILQKTLMKAKSTPPKVPQPRIINQSVASKPRTPASPMIRNVVTKSNQIRNKVSPNVLLKPKFNLSPAPVTKNVVNKSPANIARKIGNTTVYRTNPNTPTTTPNQQNRIPQTKQTIPSPLIKKAVQKDILQVQIPQTTTPKPIINMPSLEEEPAPVSVANNNKSTDNEQQPATEVANLSSLLLQSNDKPMYITGDDGTIYEVVGHNEEGQTILLAKDSDGQQQCLLVTNDAIPEETQQPVENQENQQAMMEVDGTVEEETGDDKPLVAQFLRSEPPSPGGTHKVVVMLPGGELMVTQVTPEEYASLELDK